MCAQSFPNPEASQGLPDDGGASPAPQLGTLQLRNKPRTMQRICGVARCRESHPQNFPAPFSAVQLNGAIDIFCDIRAVIGAIIACHHHCKFTQPETILNLNCILKNYYPPPLCKLALWFICGNHFKKYTFRNTYTTWCLFHMASHNYFAVCEHDENSFIILWGLGQIISIRHISEQTLP